MEYEALLNEAMKNVVQSDLVKKNSCGRFEILAVAGHFEGSRTVITNFLRVASCIRRSPEHLAKFLAKELASSVEISGERLILSRRVPSASVNEKISKYVNCYVLCPSCKKPDTELAEENCKFFIRCLACGNRAEVHK